MFLGSAGGRFSVPACTIPRRRAQRRSRRAAGHRAAARSVLDGREHGASLDHAGTPAAMAPPCRVMVLSAVRPRGQPQHGVGEADAPMSRARSHRCAPQRRTRGRQASSRLGQATALASGGSRGLLAAQPGAVTPRRRRRARASTASPWPPFMVWMVGFVSLISGGSGLIMLTGAVQSLLPKRGRAARSPDA